MKSPVTALIGYEFRKSWWVLTIGLLLTLGLMKSMYTGLTSDEPLAAGALSLLLLLGTLVSSILVRMEGRDSQVVPGFLLTMPLNTHRWTAIHITYGVAAMSLVAGIATYFHLQLYEPVIRNIWNLEITVFGVVLGIAALTALIEGIFLFAGNARSAFFTIIVVVVAVIGFMYVSFEASLLYAKHSQPLRFHPVMRTHAKQIRPNYMLPCQVPPDSGSAFAHTNQLQVKPEKKPIQRPWQLAVPYVWWLWLAILGLSYPLAHAGAAMSRRGVQLQPQWLSGTLHAMSLTKTPGSFRSSDQALRWLEWRRFGIYLTMISGIIAFGCLVMGASDYSSAILLMIGAATLFMGTYITLRRHWDHTSNLNAFFFTLPMSNRAIAHARLRMGLKTVACLVGISVLAFTLSVDFYIEEFQQGWANADLFSSENLFWASVFSTSIFAIYWILLYQALSCLYGYALMSAVHIIIQILMKNYDDDAAVLVEYSINLFLIVGFYALLISVWAYKKKLLLMRPFVAILFCGVLICSTEFLLYYYECINEIGSVSSCTAILILLASAPFASVPLEIAWRRHR